VCCQWRFLRSFGLHDASSLLGRTLLLLLHDVWVWVRELLVLVLVDNVTAD
jgi:hypothetical protein